MLQGGEIDGDGLPQTERREGREASPDKMTPLAVAHDSVRHYDFAGGASKPAKAGFL